MTITRADVADLRPGDVVELFRNEWPDGTTVRGPLYEASHWLYVAEEAVRGDHGTCVLGPSYTLTVVSRAPRPLYVNHDRAEPVPGDVVRGADDDSDTRVWMRDAWAVKVDPDYGWNPCHGDNVNSREELPARLRLLVDGETGMPPAATP